jgi:hypothetical protein
MKKTRSGNLDSAIRLAVDAHEGRVDKAGASNILHPLRVMLRMKTEQEMITAFLHDVIEDSKYTLADLAEIGFPTSVIEALDCLTHREGETYEAFIDRLKPNPIARRIKLADLEDNMDVTRLSKNTSEDITRLREYLKARERLNEGETRKLANVRISGVGDSTRFASAFVPHSRAKKNDGGQ